MGIDPAASLIGEARRPATALPNVTFKEADGRSLPFEASAFDVVVFDSTLSHMPGPERALAEAFRVLRPTGWLAVFDGDRATATVAHGDHDPLQALRRCHDGEFRQRPVADAPVALARRRLRL